MVYRGRVSNGKVVIDNGASLPEGAEVEITVCNGRPEANGPVATLYDQLSSIIGSVPDLPEDLSVNHDHYLYGLPKQG